MYKRIYIEITNVCNLNCKFCPKNAREKRYMTIDEFRLVLDKIKDETNHIYLHVMGEPTLHPNFKELLDEISKTNLYVNLTTNGTLIEKHVDTLNNCKNIRKLAISVQALEESNITNYKERLTNILNALTNLRKDIILEYRFWNHDKTIIAKEMTDIILRHYNAKEYYPELLVDNKHHNKNRIEDNTFIMYDETFTWPVNGKTHEQGYCQALKTQIAILVDGSVVPCCLDNEGKMVLGNIYNSSLEEIRQSKLHNLLLTNFRNNKRVTDLCKSCTFNKK